MLKITRVSHKGRGLTIKLEGEVFGPWGGRRARRLHEAWPAVRAPAPGPGCRYLIDAAGVELLRDLIAEGVKIAACSSFVRELLHLKS